MTTDRPLGRDQLVAYVDTFVVGLIRRAGLKVSVSRTSYGRKIKVTIPGGGDSN